MLKEILSSPTQSVSKAGRFAIFQVKLWTHCARLLKKNRAGQQAAALAYHTIFGIVPLAIMVLLIFNSFPAYSDVGEKVKTLVYDQMHLSTIEYPDPANPDLMVVDPLYNNQYAVQCYNFDFWPGKLAYLDTPVILYYTWSSLFFLWCYYNLYFN